MPTSTVDATAAAKRPLRVLIIEDYEEDARLLERHLGRAGFAVDALRVETAEELTAALASPTPWQLVIADYTLPSFNARDALHIIQMSGLDLPFIIVSGTIDEVSAVDAMRAGAHDYVLKGHLERLLPAIERELADAVRRRQRVETEAELRLAQQRFSATFNQAAVGMAHTLPSGQFLLVNQRLTDMLGLPRERVLSLHMDDFFLSSEQNLGADQFNALLEGNSEGFRLERSIVRATGETFPAQITVSLLSHPTDGSTLLWVVEDISARKAAERETADLMTRLINSERLAAAGRMANTLAHEINNPLEALTNIFFILQQHEDATPTMRELVGVGARELERVGHITRSTLSFYRKVPGKTLDLYSLLHEVVQLFSSRAAQHGITFSTQIDEAARGIHYDPALRQVFANLVGNALEAMEATGGRILVRARVRAGAAIISVADSGHGIAHENYTAIFEPFFSTKGEKGTGLGLWVTRGIVEEHGGKLNMRSATYGPHRGTTIRVQLPAPGVS